MLQLDYLITRQTLKAPRNTALAFGTYQRYFTKGQAKTTGFNPTNECADFWSAAHSYNFII